MNSRQAGRQAKFNYFLFVCFSLLCFLCCSELWLGCLLFALIVVPSPVSSYSFNTSSSFHLSFSWLLFYILFQNLLFILFGFFEVAAAFEMEAWILKFLCFAFFFCNSWLTLVWVLNCSTNLTLCDLYHLVFVWKNKRKKHKQISKF